MGSFVGSIGSEALKALGMSRGEFVGYPNARTAATNTSHGLRPAALGGLEPLPPIARIFFAPSQHH